MPTYSYTGFAKNGKPVKGLKEALSRQAALSQLMAEGMYISDISEKAVSSKKKRFGGRKNLTDLFFQLSLLLRSGIPLVTALEIIIKSSTGSTEKEVLSDISTKVSEGHRFSEAMSRHEAYFSGMYVNLVRASENVGRLAQVLMDMAAYEEEKRKNTGKLTGALIYPLVVICFGLGIVGFMLAFVVPKMQGIFASAKQEIPTATKLLLWLADFVQSYWLLFIVSAVLCTLLLRYLYTGKSRFRMWADKKLHGIPLIAQSAISRFTHVLAFQLREGLPLTDALHYAGMTVQNVYFKGVIERVRADVQAGVRFSSAVRNAGIFPELFPAAVSTGESSGNMTDLLDRVSEFYGTQIEKVITNFLSVIEPLFLVLIGVVVAFIVIAIMLPLMSINTMVG